ncbi:hypothetical protein VB780_18380 [Leptolyngbya sp. CCNP1308]|uniref:hypothetical protein n=1 Tax=Leptolyngbya sp. CCNP1308 TaxID=3110255 RepID=UPI002B215C0F|nr:hypothetical protein [Leptolyngbya sp. CCNP1308]MEA5450552.1 hypothetical protein [Leptolyngbya sp. CCNP1308]
MKRQVIQNVLNLPGISGMALIDGRNRPFFFGPDISLNSQQQDALAQGIQQVVETTPAHFDTFTFRFAHQLAHIYKLDQGLILLVLINDQMPLTDYRTAIGQLKATLVEAPHNAVPTFRLLAGCVTLGSSVGAAEIPAAEAPQAEPAASNRGTLTPSCREVIESLNHLSEGATQYLGTTMVINTWKQSRPAHPWLEQFEVQKDGHFTVAANSEISLTAEQHQWVKDWVTAFLGRGGRTIRNFQTLVAGQTLTPQEQLLLLGPPPRA